MEIQHQITEGTRRHSFKEVQLLPPVSRIRLCQHIANACLIPRIFESNQVVCVAVDGLAKLAGWKKVLCQIQNGDVAMVGIFGEQVQYLFVLTPFSHEIVQDQDATLAGSKPFA